MTVASHSDDSAELSCELHLSFTVDTLDYKACLLWCLYYYAKVYMDLAIELLIDLASVLLIMPD
jgi:hypothetical protein